MKKSILLLFTCLIISGFAYSKTLFFKKGLITNTYTNQFNDPNWSLEVSCADEDGALINGICYIKEGCKVTVKYDGAIVGGGGDGTSQGSGGSETATEVYITKPGNIREKLYGNKTIECKKDDCFCIEFYKTDNNTLSDTPEFVVQICTVNEIYGLPGKPCIICNGNIFFYSGIISFMGSIEPYELLINCENVYAIHENDSFPKFIVKKNSKIKLTYDGASKVDEGSLYKTKRYTSVSTRFKLNEKQNVDENTDVILSLCQTGLDNSTQVLKKISFITDDNPPEINVYPEITNGEWHTKTVEISGSDGETGIRHFEIKKEESNTPVVYANVNGTAIPLTESGKYKITAEDNVGNISTKDVWIDKETPEIKITDKEGAVITANKKGWYTEEELKISAEDNLSGAASLSVNEEIKKNPYSISENGNYKITAKDKAGNEKTINVKVDNKAPSITTDIIQFERNERGHITKITTKATAEEKGNNSGISSVIIQDGAGKMVASKILDDSTEELTVKAELSLDRRKLQEIKLKAVAEDVAMNIAEKSYEDIFIPPAIELECSDTYIHENKIITKLKLGNYSGNEIYYEGLKLKKIIYIDGKEVTEENFTRYFEESARENWREVTREQEISKEEIKHGVYDDILPAESGFGHKQTGYKIKWQLKNCIENEEGIWEESEVKTIVTSDTKGTIRIKIEGKGEEKEIDFTEGKFTEGNEGIKLAADGCVRVKILVDDADYEPYEIELRQQIAAGSNGEILSITRPGFIQKGTSGKAIYEGYDERYEKNKWVSFEQPEYLAYNRETCLYLRIKEGYKGNETIIESGRIYLKSEPLDMGGFTLTVCEEADYNANGITATPYQCVELELSGDSETAEWSYGDGVTNIGRTVAHEWPQKDDRTGDTSEYELKINCKNNEIFIPVHIVDTKAGYLYGNEVWWGNHEILGSIKVKEGQKLKIGKLSGNEVMEILCIADEEEKYMGSLEVKGQLEIENGTGSVNMTAGINTAEGMEKETGIEGRKFLYWKGIEVYDGGEAVINGAEINGGQRGIAVASDGEATVNKSILRRNGIGVHVLGKFNAENIEVADNAEYGIKEEDGSSVKIKASVVQNNTVEWYDADDGVLTIEEIKEKITE